MTRLVKILTLTGLTSVYLMQGACTYKHGLSIIPNGLIPNPFVGLLDSLMGMFT